MLPAKSPENLAPRAMMARWNSASPGALAFVIKSSGANPNQLRRPIQARPAVGDTTPVLGFDEVDLSLRLHAHKKAFGFHVQSLVLRDFKNHPARLRGTEF